MARSEDQVPAAGSRRVFIAVPLSDEVRAQVADLVDRVRRPGSDGAAAGSGRRDPLDVRWVRMEGLHLTLRFLGPTAEERLTSLEEVVRDVAARERSFEIMIGGAGAFPSVARPRALWLGVTSGADQLRQLAAGLDELLTRSGWPSDERPFRAHLTLARADGVRSGPAAARRLIAAAEGFSAAWRADRLVLFESHTGGGAARYESLAEGRLEEPAGLR